MEKSTNKPVQNKTDVLAPVISHNDSPKKCNLSFSINFDFYDANSDNSTDSENADLQIDISEVDDNEPSSKHKRETVEEISVLNEMEEEIERQLDAKAAKTNLTATNVKNILKHVITYEHLMSMVQKWLQNDVNCGPKLTRAKAKKLADAKVMPWPITISNKTSSEVQALIQEELPEDSSDEEYKPEHDKQSDDDREVESTTNSDIESQPSTPADVVDIASTEQHESLHVQYDPEGIFKIPVTPHVSIQEESIGQRTRSKLSLSETSLEQIEQAFIPPDITADMDDWGFEPDEDWDNFKKEFTQPLAQELATEDDPEADPEYNILEDEEIDLLDKEELRTDKAVEVSRKESYDLIAELLEELSDTFSTQEQEVLSEKETLDNITPPIEDNTMNCSTNLLPVLAEPELPTLVNPVQRLLLATQFRQHVQLMVQHFVMTYMHPEYNSLAKICKQNLNGIRYLNNGPNSTFNVENLEEALKLVSIWENKFSSAKFYVSFKKSLVEKVTKTRMYCTSQWRHQQMHHQFFPELEKSFVESKALMYPQLLPHMPFKGGLKQMKNTIPYLKSEENLVAFGIEQFLPHVASKPSKFRNKRMQLFDAAQLTHQYLLPCRNAQGILYHISKRRASHEENPIKHYFEKGCAPRIIHYVSMAEELKAPKSQPIEFLPLRWQIYLSKQKNRKSDSMKTNKHMFNSYGNLGKQKVFMNETMKLYPIVPSNHPLRNPIVNMLPKILPTTSNPKDSNINMNATCTKRTILGDNDKKVLDNNVETTEEQTGINKYKTFHNLLKVNAEEIKSTQTDKLQDKSNAKLNNILTRSSKVSDNSPEISSGLRKTTPRLAKIRSAQNMKLMAQVLGSKNCSTLKSKEKNSADKTVSGDCTVSKIDNEEEIAELMLASTTIIKDSVSRKKAKQTRELEIIKRLIKAENPLTEEERETKFAASYFQKLLLTLESNNPEVFRAVIKLYLDYSDKLDRTVCDSPPFLEELHSPNKETLQNRPIQKDILTVKLYENICKKLQSYPEMCAVFLLFLKPHQAAMIDKSVEYMMLQKMNDFVRVAQIYFAKQPSRIAKMMQAITQLSTNPHTTLANVHTVMSSVFKGHPLVMDLFLQVLPTAKPPESLFASHLFENLTCPLGSCDKNVTFNIENAPELYENIELPAAAGQEDPYGGEHCKCDCHNTDVKSNSEHCVSCGTRFLNGRIYLQTPEGLRPAKITFPGEDQEKLENIARVSSKTADKVGNPPISSKKRRKKNDSSHNDICQKQCATKYLLLNEDNEKIEVKPKRGVKFALKTTNQRKVLKRVGIVDHVIANKRMLQCKEENKAEESDILLVCNELGAIKQEKINECSTESSTCVQLSIQNTNPFSSKIIAQGAPNSNIEYSLSSKDAAIPTTAVEDDVQSKSDSTNIKPWTRQEDMILLQRIKKEYSENSFQLISEKLANRTVEQVKERCQTLLSLLQKMM
ncbi:PREDICTED: uncharacterized protein LOC106749390 isoform X2 [Dinoponera quadriceps]|uniref:Uncharacterized protein LOC106749390 isoform X2 n=1 Tax=Dinoponera quadriceps TaxID=609295 RepID=A0A6P3Y0F1_DINQU|nr:PREDICTED: uncharacterized protein LOC106749390 isoform X2 [Dinoponera quadriceps]